MLNSSKLINGICLDKNKGVHITNLLKDYVLAIDDFDAYLRRVVKRLYHFACCMIPGFDIDVWEDDTIDTVIIRLVTEINENTEYDIDITNDVKIIKWCRIHNEYGWIPLKVFYDQRKNKKVFKTLLKVLANLDNIGYSMFDNPAADYIQEYISETISYDDPTELSDYYHAFKEFNTIITWMLKQIKNSPKRIYKKELEHLYKEAPQFKNFVEDCLKIFKLKNKFWSFNEIKIGEEYIDENAYIDLDDCFQFVWEGPQMSAYDHHIFQHMDIVAGEQIAISPNVCMSLFEFTSKKDLLPMKKRAKEGELMIKIFHEPYDFYR